MLKIVKNVKNNGTYNTFHGLLSQEWMDGRYWSSALICHGNQNDEYLHNFDSGLYWNHVATCYQVGCIGKSRNIPDLKQSNIREQGNPSMKSQFWDPQTHSRIGTSPKTNWSYLPSQLAQRRCDNVVTTWLLTLSQSCCTVENELHRRPFPTLWQRRPPTLPRRYHNVVTTSPQH